MSTEAALRSEIARDQELSGLPAVGIATVEAVHRRCHQVAFVTAVVAFGLLFATLVSENVVDIGAKSWIDADVTRFALAAFSAGIACYAWSQDRHLRQVLRRREILLALDGEIASSLLSAGLVLDAVTALHGALELDELLPTIVEQGRNLLGGDCGVLWLAEPGQAMLPVVGNSLLAARVRAVVDVVAGRNDVVGVSVDGGIHVGVPIRVENALLAVLVVPDVATSELNADTKALLVRFGAAAGSALLNARRYEASMYLLDAVHDGARGHVAHTIQG